jgi:hypothetical protein
VLWAGTEELVWPRGGRVGWGRALARQLPHGTQRTRVSLWGAMSASPIERLNRALAGRYVIERELGEGGMATVYLARDLKHGAQGAPARACRCHRGRALPG